MARATNKLTALQVSKIKTPGRYGDGNGLYLQVKSGGTKSWLYRFMLEGRARMMGLGAVGDVSLAEARVLATAARKLLRSGVDPLDAKRAER